MPRAPSPTLESIVAEMRRLGVEEARMPDGTHVKLGPAPAPEPTAEELARRDALSSPRVRGRFLEKMLFASVEGFPEDDELLAEDPEEVTGALDG